MIYQVILSPEVENKIWLQARHIAHESGSVGIATRWLEELLSKIDTLEQWPRSCPLAAENEHRPYEIRKLSFGEYRVLLTVDDNRGVVDVIGFRHGRQQPQDDLPHRRPLG